MTNTALIVAVAVVIVVAAVVAWLAMERRRRRRLRERFGPEYQRVVQETGDARRAEATLEAREKRVSSYRIRELDERERDRFTQAWRQTQAKFVDDPAAAVTEADRLVTEVMSARGYPMSDFDRRAEDLTVEHGNVVQHYREARDIAARHSRHEASTEDLRQALVHYRELFADLLDTPRSMRRSA